MFNENLASVISRLYKPVTTKVQVFALSRAEAKKLPLLETVAVISITSAAKGEATLAGFNHILRLSFEDVDFNSNDLSFRAKHKLSGAFQPSQAIKIIEFIDNLPTNIRSIVIHCEGGYSRSCAVAMFLYENYNCEVELNTLNEYNPSVKQLLNQELGSKRKNM